MIIRDYVVKEVMRTFAGVFTILILIILSTQLLKSLAAVANGKISIDFLFALIALKNIESLTLILPLTLFFSILLALSRLYKDSEMIAFSACGIGPGYLLKCILIVIFVFVFVEMGFSLVLSPWASYKVQIAKEQFKLEAEIELITPGQFNLSDSGSRVLYAEDMSGTELNNVFLHVDNADTSSVLASDDANLVTNFENGARYIVFKEGSRYDGSPGVLDYRYIKFKEYGVLLEGKTLGKITLDRDAQPTKKLWNSENKSYRVELQWRISQVLMMIILSMLAVPLSKTSPRQGRYGKMALAILIYIAYSNLLVVGMSWVKKDIVDISIGIWWVHISFFVLFLFLFFRQMGWLSFFRRKNRETLNCCNEFDDLVED